VPRLPQPTVATKAWPPNVAQATRLLHPRGVAVVAHEDEPPLPFGDEAFDLVTSRHPVTTWWDEIARVLRPGGRYFSQQAGPTGAFEVAEHFLGPRPEGLRRARYPQDGRRAAEAAGLRVTDLRSRTLRMEFFDVGAVVYFLRKVIWIVPGFTVGRFRDELWALHERIEADGVFVAHSARFLIEARRPA
jgi:SAM-dependent methyltransferase